MFDLLVVRFEGEEVAAGRLAQGLEGRDGVPGQVNAEGGALAVHWHRAASAGDDRKLRARDRSDRFVGVGPRHHEGLR